MYKISLDNAFEADLFVAMLEEEKIPYTVVDHSSLVFDGLFQMTMGWGHVEVPEEYGQAAESLHRIFVTFIKEEK